MTHNLWSLYKQHHVQSCCQQEKLQQNQINQPWSLFWSIFFSSSGINRFTFEVPTFFFFFGTLCLCKWPDVEVITLSASVEKVSLFTLFVLLFAWIRCKRPGSDKPLLRLKQMQPWDCSFVPVCIQNGSYFSFTLQRFYRCVAECIEIFFFLPGITHLVFFVKERKLLTILFAKAEV